MDLATLLAAVIGPVVSGTLAAWVVHILSRRRDRDSVRRERVVDGLVTVYTELSSVCTKKTDKNIRSDRLTILLSDLVLLGDANVVRVSINIRESVDGGKTELDVQNLLTYLTANIRGELGLPQALDAWAPVLRISSLDEARGSEPGRADV